MIEPIFTSLYSLIDQDPLRKIGAQSCLVHKIRHDLYFQDRCELHPGDTCLNPERSDELSDRCGRCEQRLILKEMRDKEQAKLSAMIRRYENERKQK